jgi:hypothetical protein
MVAYTFSQLVDFTRVSTGANLSPGTFVGSNGLIQLSTASANLLLWTQEFDNAAWVKTSVNPTANSVAAPDGTMTADTLTASGANGTTLQTYTAAAVPYVFSVWLRRLTGTGNIQLTVDGATYSTVAVTATWTRFEATLTPAAGSRTAGIRIVTSGDAVYAWGAELELGSTATAYTRNVGGVFPPRFDFNPITLAPLGILIEETRANLLFPSEDFSTWSPSSTITTTNTTVAPDGTTNGDTVKADASTSAFVSRIATFTGNGDKSFSVFLKAGTSTATRIILRDTTVSANRGGANITWAAGVPSVAVTEGTLQGVDTYPNGWYRVRMLATGVLAGNTNQFCFSPDTAVGTNTTIFWGAQAENGEFATSYIPTTGTALTRNADRAAIVAPMFTPWFSASAGTFVAKFDLIGSATSTLRRHVWNGTDAGNQRLSLRGIEPATGFPLAAIGTGTSVVSFNGTALTVNTPVNIAVAYGTNMAYSQNGAAAITDPSAASVSISSLDIGSNLAGTLFLNGHLRSIDYYPTRLSNAQLQALTI